MPLPSSILWGIDPVARAIAGKFLSSQETDGVPASGLQLFEPTADAVRELRQTLALSREPGPAGTFKGEPEVIMLACAYAPEAQATVDLLRSTSEMLETALPGSQSIVLVVSVPPPLATDEEKVRTWDFFLALEPLAGNLPFLNIIFVSQISSAVYKDVSASDLLCEVLARKLRDGDLQEIIRGRGFASTRNPLRAGGRSCCYATVGLHRLVYQAAETMAYLRARFCNSMFDDGFLNPAAVTDQEERLIQGRVADLIGSQLGFWSGHLPTPGQVTASAFSQPLDPESKAQAIVGLEQEFERALRPEAARFEQDLGSGAASVRDAFRDYLQVSTGLIAGAARFLDMLGGADTGIGLFEETFCRAPLVKRIEEIMGPLFTRTLAGAGVNVPPPQKQEESRWEWLGRAVDSVRGAAQVSDPGPASPLRFFCMAFDCLIRYLNDQPYTADGTRELLREVANEFAGESMELFGIADGLRKEYEAVADQLKELPGHYPWLRRVATQHAKFRGEQAELQSKLEEIENRRRNFERSFEGTREILLAVVNQVILPHMPRVRVKGRLLKQALEVAEEFQSFVVSVGTPLEKNWEDAPSGMETEGAGEESALTEHRRELLYRALLGGKTMIYHAQAALAFTGASRDAGAQPSYQNCRTLHDHCKVGAISLLDRIDDYASTLLGPLAEADILEVIELEGKDAARQYLLERASRAAHFLEFASGLTPLVGEILHSTFAVKVLHGADSRLSKEYKAAFMPDWTFIDYGHPFCIEIVSLKFGFPAFLIQGLNEARRLAQAATGALTADLWPEPKAEMRKAPEA